MLLVLLLAWVPDLTVDLFIEGLIYLHSLDEETLFDLSNYRRYSTVDFKQLQNACHQTAKEKGFWDKPRNTGELLMLVVSELGEALEADRKDKRAAPEKMSLYYPSELSKDKDSMFKTQFEEHIKGSFEEELADVMIRMFDLAGGMKINLEYFIEQKMRYNATRERLHGKRY